MVDLVKIRKKAKTREPATSLEPVETPQAGTPQTPVGKRETEPTIPMPNATASAAPETAPEVAAEPQANAHSSGTSKLERFKQTAGKRREGFVGQEVETSSAGQVELLSFVIAGEQYAVSIDHLVEIVTPRSATPVPNADPTIVGIISLRGTIVTVIDVRRKLRHPPAAAGNDARIIVAERAGETLGFEVDRVLRVLKVDSAAIEPHPVVHSSELSEAVRGVFRHANALTILLDLDKLLA
jgi:purine-binding chemotaxis protein CheW